MRILLDHNLDWRMWRPLQPHAVMTTAKMHWGDYDNGKLLAVAQLKFDVLLTVDNNIYHQQNVALYQIAVIVLRAFDNRYQSLLPLLPETMDLLEEIQPGEIRYVYADEKLRDSDRRRGKGPYGTNPKPAE